jgi:hypothetical protein
MTIQDKSLDTRMNELESNGAELEQVVQETDPLQQTNEVLNEDVPNDITVMEKDPVFLETEEPVQVAGLVPKFVKKILEKDIDPILKKRMEPVRGDDEYLIIPNATQSEIDDVLSKKAEQSINAKPGNVTYKNGKKVKQEDYGKFNE